MKTLTLTAEIGTDGKLVLELPTGLPPGPADIVVVVRPTSARSTAPSPLDSAQSATWEARRRAVQEAVNLARARQSAAAPESVPPADAASREAELETLGKTCSGLFLGRLPQDYDIDAALEEMNAHWKAKLEDLRVEA